ncbi:angiopoietin-related protein 2-like [Antennarius striatus]|uniref:angiopoietin-related protein 2-like n=1 Tax=Antennarius striatus TaxID=241820 RepID=UPI0035B0BE87
MQEDGAMSFSKVVLVMILLLPGPSLQEEAKELGNGNLEREFIYDATEPKGATVHNGAPQKDRCSYTFIVPQQKNDGAICVNSQNPEALLENRVSRHQLELLSSELQKQQQQIEAMQRLVNIDGGLVSEVQLLQKESRNMNSRITQLYMQLLHETIRKGDHTLEVSQLETRVLNHTHEMGRLAARYRDLEHKYQHLSGLWSNQSTLLMQLEGRCKLHSHHGIQQRSRVLHPQRPLIPPPSHQRPADSPGGYRPHHAPTHTRHSSKPMTNEIQSDQNSKVSRPPLPTVLSAAYSFTASSGPFRDCSSALEDGHTTSGMYLLQPDNSRRLMQVWCDQRRDPGGWTVIQRRQDGSVNFFRNWETYKQGFGNIDGEYWLGLENLYWLTNQETYKLLVTLEDWTGQKSFAEYASFRVESEADFYRLRVGRYHGNAGDSLTWHNSKRFTTLDRDLDAYPGNCAHYQKGGWWYNACAHSNLNGVWYRGGHYRSRHQDGVYWAELKGAAYSLRRVTMMVHPNGNTFHRQ